MSRIPLMAACAIVALPSSALAAPSEAPRLVIAISVDQFSADLFDQYRPYFTGGLGRLAGQGTVYRNGFQGHAATETCPGHSTILTGARPARTGIIANIWTDQSIAREDKFVYCAEDETVAGSTSRAYTVSSRHLRVPTLGDLLKRANPASRSVAIAGKDRAAVMMGGHGPDQRWYWSAKNRFETDLAGVAMPASVAAANQAIAATIAQPREPLEAPPLCTSRSRVVPLEGGGKPVGAHRFARAAGDAGAFRASPEYDAAILATAAALIGEMQLGRGNATDLIAIGLSATDYVGHTYGNGGEESCLQLLSLDRDLGDFLALLDKSGVSYAVTLTADHGGEDVPERLRDQGLPNATRVDPALDVRAISARLEKELNLSGPVLVGNAAGATFFGDLYLARSLPAADRPRVLAAAVAAYRAHPQVEAIFTRDDILATPAPTSAPDRWSTIERVRASFDPERSGDLFLALKPHVTPIVDTSLYAATHGSVWDYDRRVPIIFYRPGQAARPVDAAAETVDIMPTLAALIGLPLDPKTIDGHCLGPVADCPAR